MDPANIIALITALAGVLAAVVAAFAPDRSKARVEALQQAIDLRGALPAGHASTDELDRFIKFTSAGLADVWWRDPLVILGAVLTYLGLLQGVLILLLLSEGDAVTWGVAVVCVVLGAAVMVVQWWRAGRKGLR